MGQTDVAPFWIVKILLECSWGITKVKFPTAVEINGSLCCINDTDWNSFFLYPENAVCICSVCDCCWKCWDAQSSCESSCQQFSETSFHKYPPNINIIQPHAAAWLIWFCMGYTDNILLSFHNCCVFSIRFAAIILYLFIPPSYWLSYEISFS